MSYRAVATKVAEMHNKLGGSVVAVGDGKDLLSDVGKLELRIPETGEVISVEDSHLTQKNVRRAFWELRTRREWALSRGVVWSSVEGGTSYVGLGEMVPQGTPLPALTKMEVVGGQDG
jgi:hypothetical protein